MDEVKLVDPLLCLLNGTRLSERHFRADLCPKSPLFVKVVSV
jgi:hypothetical protein